MRYKTGRSSVSLPACGCWIVVLLFNILAGAWSVTYLLEFFTDKTIAWGWSALLGLIIAEISVPIAIVVKILELAGVL